MHESNNLSGELRNQTPVFKAGSLPFFLGRSNEVLPRGSGMVVNMQSTPKSYLKTFGFGNSISMMTEASGDTFPLTGVHSSNSSYVPMATPLQDK